MNDNYSTQHRVFVYQTRYGDAKPHKVKDISVRVPSDEYPEHTLHVVASSTVRRWATANRSTYRAIVTVNGSHAGEWEWCRSCRVFHNRHI